MQKILALFYANIIVVFSENHLIVSTFIMAEYILKTNFVIIAKIVTA